METNNNRTWIFIGILLIIAGASFYLGKNSSTNKNEEPIFQATTTVTDEKPVATTSPTVTIPKKPTTTPTVPALTTGNTKGFHSYSDSTYNFTIKYPPYITTKNTFGTFHEVGNNWRMYAGPANQGKAVVALPIYNIDQGSYSTGRQTYPLFFMSEVRVGVSPNTKECYTPDAGYTNQKISNVTINGIAWKKFSTSEGGMMKYIQVESYRTIRNNMCFAIEQIKNGSSYRDEKMATAKTETELTNYFNVGETILKTFTFTK